MTHDDPRLEAARARVGTALNAKWTLDEVLGVGGTANVFAATHRNRSRGALKVLHAEVAADDALRERFLREGRIANLIEHPARVAVLDDDVSDRGEPFLVRELLVGTTLVDLLRDRGGTLPLDETLAVFDVVLDLLAACRKVSVVHRGIKPANVFVERSGAVRVLDFGVARLRALDGAEAARAGSALGSPSFMSPEQALGQHGIDGRADLFSVGACIYTCLTGERVHAAESETEAYVKSATQPASSIAEVAPGLSARVVALVDRALAFDRARRFPDAETMRAELRAVLDEVSEGDARVGGRAGGAVAGGRGRTDGVASVLGATFAAWDEPQRDAFERAAAEVAETLAVLGHLDRDEGDEDGAGEGALAGRAAAGNASLDELRDAAVGLSLDAVGRSTLAAQICLSADAWLERHADAFVDAWREGVRGEDLDVLADALRAWAKAQLARKAYETTFRTYAALTRAFGDVADPNVARGLARKLAGIMFPLDALGALLADLSEGSRGSQGAHGVDEAMVRGVARALAVLDRDALFGVALECLEASGDEPLRNVLLGYLKRWLPGHEGELAPVLVRAAPKTAIPLVRLLASLPPLGALGAGQDPPSALGGPCGPAAADAIESALASPHLEVRLEALARLPEPSGQRLRDELGRLLDGDDARMRVRTLQIVAQMALAAAVPALATRIEHPDFHARSIDERRMLLETAWRLDPRRGEALALELLEERRLVSSKAHEDTRVLAAETLAQAGTSDALAALGSAAKSRWFASSTVRDAAGKAIEAIKARVAGARGGAP
jgi:hypothetical protein